MHELGRSLPPMELSMRNEIDTLGNIHHTPFLRKELSSILVVNEGFLLDTRVPQFHQQPHMAQLGVLQFQAHQVLEVGHKKSIMAFMMLFFKDQGFPRFAFLIRDERLKFETPLLDA